jgi:predicted O-linked N-acetylglucosamine transferase (SPINDLY family)
MAKLMEAAAAQRGAGDRPGLLATLAAAHELHRAGTPLPRNALYEYCVLLFQSGRLADAEARLREGLALAPADFAMRNLLGVVLKNQGRLDEAIPVLEAARAQEPANLSPVVNLGNVHLARRDGARAEAAFTQAMQAQPGNAEYHRLLGVALRHQGKVEPALARFAEARRLDAREPRNWIEPAGMLDELGRHDEALAVVEEGLALQPDSRNLNEAKFSLLRRAGRQAAVIAFGEALAKRLPDAAWVRIQLARSVMHTDRRAANTHLREAVRLEPENRDAVAELADSLDRTRGKDEAANIAAAYELALRRVALGGSMLPHARSITSILNRACNHEAADAVGSFAQLTNYWADTGYISALHYQMAQVKSDADRRLLLEAHRKWGRTIDAAAARSPLPAPQVRAARAKVRIGLMSSDLRNHPVCYFALPIIEGYDRDRYELYCYSWNSGPADAVQHKVAMLCDGFRLAPAISDRDAAALIAGDNLDMLVELGGTTYMNKLSVMAWRPAPVQASWLGYPHSAGPETIDYLVVDPYNRPTDDGLLIEKPLVLPESWVVLGPLGFSDRLPIEPGLPEQRQGHITFGTMNNPYKYTAAVLAAWARITAAVDGAHFLFVRPEGATEAFQRNVRAAFAAHGVGGDRVEFIGVRGTHMPHYNRIDIALDSFPQTGGTTTCEALWMGVPTVSLVGPAFFERLSLANLTNAGLADLAVPSLEAYHAAALALAADRHRRERIRRTIRDEIRRRPLGQIPQYVTGFMDTMRRAVEEGPARRQA